MFKRFVESFYRLPTIEEWANRNAHRTSPDEIISAAIVQSIAKDFNDWSQGGEDEKISNGRWVVRETFVSKKYRQLWRNYSTFSLTNEKKKISFKAQIMRTARDRDGMGPWLYFGRVYTVNDVEISCECGRLIVEKWEKLYAAFIKTQETAAQAKKEMDRNEMAWNLAEKLLGLKRLENGALVPKDYKEEKAA